MAKIYLPNRFGGEMLVNTFVDYPCYLCTGKMHVRYEVKAKDFVCAGCYNDFALEKGWEKQ